MKYVTLTVVSILFFLFAGTAQIYLEPFAGYQNDGAETNKIRSNFRQINAGLQLSFQATPKNALLFQVQKSFPITSKATDTAYTLNPALPLMSNANKTFEPSAWSFIVGYRLKIAGRKSLNTFYGAFYTGFTYQKIKVSYLYDKANYTILQPDQTQKRLGVSIKVGLGYMRQLKKGRIFAEGSISSPPIGKFKTYSSFKFMLPQAINIGYSILIAEKKKPKKKIK